ncbi:MAG: hypothetical protein ACOCXV_00565 [Bacteroidota bacterium]
MRKTIIYLMLLSCSMNLWSQKQEAELKSFMLQCKHEGMYLLIENNIPVASPDYYGQYFHMEEGSLTSSKNEYELLYLENNKLVMKAAPKLSEEKQAEYNEQMRIRAMQRMADEPLSPITVELPKVKAAWYYEPADDNSVYIVFPYEPFEGMVLTVTNSLGDGKYNVELKPKDKTIEERQKWQFILVP